MAGPWASDTFAGFNAEQRQHDDDMRRALDFSIDMRCRECDVLVPMGEIAAVGMCLPCYDARTARRRQP